MRVVKPTSVEEYITSFPAETEKVLQELRTIIKSAAPRAAEVISYHMPAYKQNGVLVYFAACKHHIGFYPTSSPINVFKEELKNYKTSKGAIQFPYDQPLPKNLITQIVEFRVKEDTESAFNKTK